MNLPFAEGAAGSDAHLFLIPMALLAAALALSTLLLVLQVMPTTTEAGLAVEPAPALAALPPSA